ncbi:alginate O-acetyltransferase AlgF [Deinococcus yavapaiensis]|uniref:Alginate biosynthesis protein AlgF n=1 Tax=Deinococcus yavapaiensis KR-236 TaxID=694435 RepID=A0A318S2R2_9DEIO|nr:alginate O-acetyltransferase AlgF [Deinococcus yavapaiensis]PYE52821.1 alginate O-acetyltransferase complex protein AlgF [Deinococcus yavapaiensis KR-236]
MWNARSRAQSSRQPTFTSPRHAAKRPWMPALLTLGLGLSLSLSPSSAQTDDGLYEAAPPPDSAFVRLINTAARDVTATLGSAAVSVPSGNPSPYRVVRQGNVVVASGAVRQTLRVAAGRFYSVVVGDGSPRLVEDPDVTNRGRALVVLYNFGEHERVDLRTADGKTTVLEDVKRGLTAQRLVNGVRVTFAVFAAGKAIETFREVELERGAAYSVVVTKTSATLTRNSTLRP